MTVSVCAHTQTYKWKWISPVYTLLSLSLCLLDKESPVAQVGLKVLCSGTGLEPLTFLLHLISQVLGIWVSTIMAPQPLP